VIGEVVKEVIGEVVAETISALRYSLENVRRPPGALNE